MKMDNPVRRLLDILLAGKNIIGKTPCKTAWGRLLNVDENDQSLFMSRLGKMMALSNESVEQLHLHHPTQDDIFAYWQQRINKGFSVQNLNGSWDTFINHIDTHSINYLRQSAELLDKVDATKIVSEDELTTIRKNIDELIEEVVESDLDKEIKKYITRHLRKILISIDEYKISGITPVVESLEIVLGHVMLNKKYRDSFSNTVGEKFLILLQDILKSVCVNEAASLATNVIKLITSN